MAEDWLTGRFHDSTKQFCRANRGSGKSGSIAVDIPHQEILERTSVFVSDEYVGARLVLGLPALGRHNIDLNSMEQLVDPSQTRAIADAIYCAKKHMNNDRTLKQTIDAVLKDLDDKGLDVLDPSPAGDYALFRGLELAAAINRLRTLSVRQKR